MERLRSKTVLLSERHLMFVLAGQLYSQAPNHKPRKADVILDKVQKEFRKDCLVDNGDWYYKYIEENKLYEYLYNMLFAIPEFEELNLSQIEFENGVKVHDENRAKFSFTSAYDVGTEDSWKDDFVDLDAFMRNMEMELKVRLNEHECFFCINKDTEECEKCNLNKKLTDRYKEDRTPKGHYTMSCAFDCPGKGNMICCIECSEKGLCKFKCPGDPKTCNNMCKFEIKNEEDNK